MEEYYEQETLKKIQQVQADILKDVLELCKKYKIDTFVIFGSALGVVRHQGFIPWDDDIDIAMPRDDYDKLIELATSKMVAPYFFQVPENDPECFYGGYGKLRNSMTSGIESFNSGHRCNQGIWIDIFPLDNCYEDKEKHKKHVEKINFAQQLLWYKVYPERKGKFNDISKGKLYFIKLLSKLISHKRMCRYLNNVITECEDETENLAILSRYMKPDKVAVFEKKDFEYSILMEFEDIMIPVPIGYKNWLCKNVGNDYMIYPRPKYRAPHHRAKFLTDKSYQENI